MSFASASSVLDVRDTLKNLYTAAINDPKIVVCFDLPSTWQPGTIVAVGDVLGGVDSASELIGGGQYGHVLEDYDVVTIIDVFQGGELSNQQTTREAVRLWQICSTTIRNDLSLGLTNGVGFQLIKAMPVNFDIKTSNDAEHKGRRTRLTFNTHILAQT